MDNTPCRQFFLEPAETYHRRYEALRAFFVDGRRLKDIAQQFGYQESSLRSLWCVGFGTTWRRLRFPLFVPPSVGRPAGRPALTPPLGPERPAIADRRCLSLTPGRCWRSRVAGLFLFLPLLARVQFDQRVSRAGYPGSAQIPATSALLSLLTLKLLDKERRSHIDDFNFDEAVGLFAGLNIPPKKSYATEYSYRTGRDHQQQLLSGGVGTLAICANLRDKG